VASTVHQSLAEGAEAAATELATVFSFTAGRDMVTQSRLIAAVAAALPRRTEPVGGDVEHAWAGPGDDEGNTWRGER